MIEKQRSIGGQGSEEMVAFGNCRRFTRDVHGAYVSKHVDTTKRTDAHAIAATAVTAARQLARRL